MANRDKLAVDAGMNDLLGSVIQTDRRQSGRGQEQPVPTPVLSEEPSNAPTPPAAREHYDTKTVRQNDIMTEPPPNDVPEIKALPPTPKKKLTKETSAPAPPDTLLVERRKTVRAMAKTPTVTVTLRIPNELNAWLDEYMHGSWRTRVRKQDLVIEGLKLLYARRGKVGEKILDTELLEDIEGEEEGS